MDEFIKIFGFIADIAGIGGALFSLLIWLKMKYEKNFNEQRISIRLKMPQKTVDLPYKIERKHLTRSEVQGLLGVLPMKGEGQPRFSLSFLNTGDYFVNLKNAQDSKEITFVEITCTENEMQQFDIEKIQQQCRVTAIAEHES